MVIPRVYSELCGENTLVLEYLEGIQVGHTKELVAAGHKLSDVARKIGHSRDDDLRAGLLPRRSAPGNLLVLQGGRIGLLDFGLCRSCRRLRAPGRDDDGLVHDRRLARAFAAAEKLGFHVASMRPENLRSLMLMTIGDTDTETGFFELLGETHLERIPEDFALVGRTLILLNGLSHRLAPGRRLIQAELLKHLAAGAREPA